jgi:hypothetical protein
MKLLIVTETRTYEVPDEQNIDQLRITALMGGEALERIPFSISRSASVVEADAE